MRAVVVGIGAVGGLLAARLARAGTEVLAIARGEHGRVVAADGLVVHSPMGTEVVPLDVVDASAEVTLRRDDVIMLAVKSHQTADALQLVRRCWPLPLPIVCVQNGVANERFALRLTPSVIGCNVLLPATHLEPGHVHAHWGPTSGVLDLGRYPAATPADGGIDAAVESLCALLRAATFSSEPMAQIMEWKHAKLLMNLGNAVEAVCGPRSRGGPLSKLLVDEGRTTLAAAGIPTRDLTELAARVAAVEGRGPGGDGSGGSTWQSIRRSAGGVETDYLNGEIVLVARRHGLAAPVNDLVRELTIRWAALPAPPPPLPEQLILDSAALHASTNPATAAATLIDDWTRSLT